MPPSAAFLPRRPRLHRPVHHAHLTSAPCALAACRQAGPSSRVGAAPRSCNPAILVCWRERHRPRRPPSVLCAGVVLARRHRWWHDFARFRPRRPRVLAPRIVGGTLPA
ncbi:hypothetical protein HYPSUDRAFT_201501 [Hypholoma sublateritium FD-334 SS-4]|uniref:Uncharacterized protein n=1 Tax=Hypholoma sublateritium (strain FD-334 SS-4) TaxID=945553 RepID=A0A0D2MHU5_HYPSF|nr:hypothetical protein HYPSUDRAFT_201501 [Hypholoma sublateritium FD-334 SS-4]